MKCKLLHKSVLFMFPSSMGNFLNSKSPGDWNGNSYPLYSEFGTFRAIELKNSRIPIYFSFLFHSTKTVVPWRFIPCSYVDYQTEEVLHFMRVEGNGIVRWYVSFSQLILAFLWQIVCFAHREIVVPQPHSTAKLFPPKQSQLENVVFRLLNKLNLISNFKANWIICCHIFLSSSTAKVQQKGNHFKSTLLCFRRPHNSYSLRFRQAIKLWRWN